MVEDVIDITDIGRCYEDLANAIITQAANDYRNELRRAKKSHLKALEKFFVSEWFSILTKADGVEIMNAIRKECKNESNSRTVNT